MSYSLSMYWEDLKSALENYREIKADSTKDQVSFLKQLNCLKEMYALSIEMESKIWPLDKLKYAKQIFNIYAVRFGKEEIPEIVGAKSYDFAKKVLYPHLARSLDIHYSEILIKLGKKFGFDIDQINEHSRQLMDKLTKSCDEYKNNSGYLHFHWFKFPRFFERSDVSSNQSDNMFKADECNNVSPATSCEKKAAVGNN